VALSGSCSACAAVAPAGAIVVDEEGYPVADDENGVIGQVFLISNYATNNFSFKGLSLLVQVDMRRWSSTVAPVWPSSTVWIRQP
jgi:hypothetical protein